MRKIRFLAFLIFFSVKLMGQSDSTGTHAWRINKYYGNAGVVLSHPGTFIKGTTGLYFGNHWGLAFGGMQTYYKTKNLPRGYKAGFCLVGDCTPKDKVRILSLQPGREFNFRDDRISVVMSAGPSCIVYEETQFKAAGSRGFGSFFEGSNYDSFVNQQRVLGLSVHTQLLFQPFRHFAIGVGWSSNLNKARATHGVEISIIGGVLRYRRKIPKPTARSIEIVDSLRSLKKTEVKE
jgi:hypothetical protein